MGLGASLGFDEADPRVHHSSSCILTGPVNRAGMLIGCNAVRSQPEPGSVAIPAMKLTPPLAVSDESVLPKCDEAADQIAVMVAVNTRDVNVDFIHDDLSQVEAVELTGLPRPNPVDWHAQEEPLLPDTR